MLLTTSTMPTALTFDNWHFKRSTDTGWTKSHTNSAVTEIFPDLVNSGDIPDPLSDCNEALVSFVGRTEWWYKASITVEPGLRLERCELVINGLDTDCDVLLNNEHIAHTKNMFRRYSVEVQPLEGINTLLLKFHPVDHIKDKPFEPITLLPEFGNDRMFVRKAQYHYGWDWGPRLITCGVYKPVELVLWDEETGKLDGVDVSYRLDVETKSAELELQAITKGGNANVVYTLKFGDRTIFKSPESTHQLSDIKMWFPFTHGDPNLYTLTTDLIFNGKIVDSLEQRLGFRQVELVQSSLDTGSTFYFRVNGLDTYVNGCNWIPASPFLTTLTRQQYKDWISLLKDGNQNMVRVWGGGIYEYDWFYQECDSLGILVWQDFMFACGQYPGDDEFVANVRVEAEQNVQRLKKHPSVVIYAGNNEDYQTRDEYKIPRDQFYARKIYEEVLPQVLADIYGGEESTTIAYIPGSPYSNDTLPADDLTIGDVHQWNVWHGKELPYQQWFKLVGRFVSEFGMEAMPSYEVFTKCITNKDELYPQSKTVEYHNKAQGFARKLSYYVYANVRILENDLSSWIYATQLVQSECMAFALLAARHRWGKNRLCGGQLVWQLNDVYPVTSWSLFDSCRVPKLGYYSVKRLSEPCIIGGEAFDDNVLNLFISTSGAQNYASDDASYFVQVDYYDMASVIVKTERFPVTVANNSTVECGCLALDEHLILCITLHRISTGNTSATVNRYIHWPQPLKHYTLSGDAPVEYVVKDGYLELKSRVLVKGVFVQCDGYLQDNGFDLVPNETKRLKVDTSTTISRVLGTYVNAT
ncbi:MAN2 [Cyberlindnera jadinii]|uniref:beta-mannosidase n=1 Tax=Cyberlindnera jadinii (strain ATCC 18201 / CBS 1600 / BCRC 20928 / JCM 3617 / NBRC 0987 / NRRL Y-1542) TaxID=983966 RepID=A0A0H5C4T5_CYBJN|nr:MAN2 [Cyberlindnera jadinii]